MLPYNKVRAGIAMIELIFAIVIMGIALLSIPNLLATSSKSTFGILEQEGVAMAASHTNALMTYAWDEKNTNTLGTYVNNKLHVGASGDNLLSSAGVSVTKFPASRRRTFTIAAASASAIGGDTNATLVDTDDDVDDFNNKVTTTVQAVLGGTISSADQGEYIDVNISQTTNVNYASDTASYDSATGVFTFPDPFAAAGPGTTTNIKIINTLLASNSPDVELQEKQIALRAFMCNIGAASPAISGGK